MDPADQQQLRSALEQQGAMLGRHSTQLDSVAASVRNLAAQIQPLQLSRSASSSTPAAAHEPRLPPPEKYSGEPGTCRSFLTQCSLIFQLQPATFPSDQAKVAYVLTQLSGRAREWGTALWEVESPVCEDFRGFCEEMKRVFDRSKHGHEAARELLHMRQGRRSVSEFAIDFQTLATSTSWNAGAIFDIFLNGLSDEIKDELVSHDLPSTCEELIDLAIRIDTRLQQRPGRRSFSIRPRPASDMVTPQPTTSTSDPQPMQVDRARLTPAERQRRMTTGSCLYCGQPDHFIATCPVKSNARQ